MKFIWLILLGLLPVGLARAQSNTVVATNAPVAVDEVAEREFQLGKVFLAEKRYADAVEAFEQAALLRPKWSAAHDHWGTALVAQGRAAAVPQEKLDRFRQAASQFEKANTLAPDQVDPLLHWSEVLVEIGDLPLEPRVRLACYQGAADKYQKAVALDDGNWLVYFRWAQLIETRFALFAPDNKTRQEIFAKAAVLYGSATANAQFSADIGLAHARWAQCLVRLAEVTADPDDKKQHWRSAIDNFAQAARIHTQDAALYHHWGAALIELGKLTKLRSDYRDGLAQLNASLALAPDQPAVLYLIAKGYALTDNPVMAVEALKDCFAKDPGNGYRALAPQDADLVRLQGHESFEELYRSNSPQGVPAYNPRISDGRH